MLARTSPHASRSHGATLLGVAVLVRLSPLWTASALAAETELSGDAAAQFYDVRSPTGETVIARRRLTVTMGVSGYDLYSDPENPAGATIAFRARLRYDADFGGTSGETDVTNYGRYVPGFERAPFDLMYGYVEGRRLFGGFFGFKLGRQYITDALGWWSFDGGLARVTTPYYFAVEAFGGLEQRGGLPLSTSRYERDGVFRADRSGYDAAMWPSVQPAEIAPAYGAAIESTGFTWAHGRLSYRRVNNTGSSNVGQFASGLRQPLAYDGTRVSQERLGYAVDATLPNVGGVKAGLAYDLYAGRFSNVFASVDAFASERVTLSADYDYYVPTFDADSIWNFFMAMPMNDLGLRAAWTPTDRLSFSGGPHARLFSLQTEAESGLTAPTSPNLSGGNYYPSSSIEALGGANLAARWRFAEGALGARGAGDLARSGDRVGVDLFGERTLETRYVFQARTGVWHWNDKLRPDRDAVSVSYVAGVGYKFLPRSLALAELQHDINRISGHRLRVMLWLTVAGGS